MAKKNFTLEDLEQIIDARSHDEAGQSYTASLISKGIEKCTQKLGEEAVETIIAALSGEREELKKESADLLYHLLVVLKSGDVSLQEVLSELESRTVQSGLEEKASRTRPDKDRDRDRDRDRG